MRKTTEVKEVCEIIYGRKIPDRTWVRWRRKLNLPLYLRFCSTGQMEQLMSLANLRQKKPLDQITLTEVIQKKLDVIAEFKNDSRIALTPASCLGKDLPALILTCIGKQVSTKTLYRWGKDFNFQFSLNTNFKKHEIEKWLSIAHSFY